MDFLSSSTSDIRALMARLPSQASLRLDINAKISITSRDPAESLNNADVVQLVS
jgi:hypothetical protein